VTRQLFRRLRRLDVRLHARLEVLGIRRAVLLTVGAAGLAAAFVAGVGAVQVGRVGAPLRSGAVVDAATADADRFQALFWRARSSSAGAVERQLSQALAEAGAGARDGAGAGAGERTAGERTALAGLSRAWQRYLLVRRARPSSAGSASAGREDAAADAVVARLDALVSSARAAAGERAGTADRAYLTAKALLVLLFCVGSLGAAGLLRLAVGHLLAWCSRRARRALRFLRDDPEPAPAAPAPAGDAGRPVGAATALLRDTARRLDARHAGCGNITDAEQDVGRDVGRDVGSACPGAQWWLHPAAQR